MVGVPARPAAAVGRRGACARGGPVLARRVRGWFPGWAVWVARRATPTWGEDRTFLSEETSRRFGTVWGGVRRVTLESEPAMGEAGACRRDALLLARGTHSLAPAWLCSCFAFDRDS